MHARPGPATRFLLYALSALLWASGALLLALQSWFRRVGEFGLLQHPAEPLLHTIHGVLAVAGLFGLGWLVARHIDPALAANGVLRARRRGGPLLLAIVVLLAGSGFALFYLTGDTARAAGSRLHEALGVLVIAPALWHWLRRGRQRGRPRAISPAAPGRCRARRTCSW